MLDDLYENNSYEVLKRTAEDRSAWTESIRKKVGENSHDFNAAIVLCCVVLIVLAKVELSSETVLFASFSHLVVLLVVLSGAKDVL